MKYNLIVAADPDGVIGYQGTMPWYFKEDLAFFKQQTLDSIVVMGRKTYDSLLVKPLPNRCNIVLSKEVREDNGELIFCRHLHTVTSLCLIQQDYYDNVYFCGGATVYEWAAKNVPLDNIYLTLMKKKYKGDTYLQFVPELLEELDKWKHDVLFDCEHYTRYRLYKSTP